MGSIFTTTDKYTIPGSFGSERQVPFYLQFVPGYVVEVVTSQQSTQLRSNLRNVNSIVAIPHISDEGPEQTRVNTGEDNRYYPLLRGMVDVPTKGDPVLLCTIGKVQYYFGPLNTFNNVNFNLDTLHRTEREMRPGGEEGTTVMDELNRNKNFWDKSYRRLQKLKIDPLDFPDYETGGVNQSLIDTGEIAQSHGDMLFEGRHGNSIRIGSRAIDPYIIMSNNRAPKNIREGLSDGTIFGITSYGMLKDIWEVYGITKTPMVKDTSGASGTVSEQGERVLVPEFCLSSDNIFYRQVYDFDPPFRTIADLVEQVEGREKSSEELIYQYRKDQVLLQSKRIIINAVGIGQAPDLGGDIFISSLQDIHVGSGRHLTISTQEDVIIESRNIYLGKKAHESPSEPLVLGQTLVDILGELIDILKEANSINLFGVLTPLADAKFAPLTTKLAPLQMKLKDILSSFHYIEKNDTQKE